MTPAGQGLWRTRDSILCLKGWTLLSFCDDFHPEIQPQCSQIIPFYPRNQNGKSCVNSLYFSWLLSFKSNKHGEGGEKTCQFAILPELTYGFGSVKTRLLMTFIFCPFCLVKKLITLMSAKNTFGSLNPSSLSLSFKMKVFLPN